MSRGNLETDKDHLVASETLRCTVNVGMLLANIFRALIWPLLAHDRRWATICWFELEQPRAIAA